MVLTLREKRSVHDRPTFAKAMARRKKKTVRKVRVAHELPKRRRMAIDEAMKAHRPRTAQSGTAHRIGAMFAFIESGSNRAPFAPFICLS